MRLRIVRYNKLFHCHECIDENGNRRMVDVTVDGGIGHEISDVDLVGRTIECEDIYPHIEIATGVQFTDDETVKEEEKV